MFRRGLKDDCNSEEYADGPNEMDTGHAGQWRQAPMEWNSQRGNPESYLCRYALKIGIKATQEKWSSPPERT